MKKKYKTLVFLLIITALIAIAAIPTFALTESEVQAEVDKIGKEGVTGNIFIWFLCAIAFLKVSQKIDSFMSSLGINVGNTGGSMLTEALVAARGVSLAGGLTGIRGGGLGRGGSSSSSGARFLQGGLVGAVGRRVTSGAIKNATGNGGGGIGGKVFASSVKKGGGFANGIIGRVAQGNIRTDGSITGENAGAALLSYMGYTAEGDSENMPSFSNVEIGGGRITGTETTSDNPNGIAMGMYSTEQHMAPAGEYTTVTAADGSTWYKQYAADTVVRTPYHKEDNSVGYNESVVKKLPKPPPRKEKI